MMKTKKQIRKEGFKVKFTNGQGAGGQARNRTLSKAVVTHITSGIIEANDDSRDATKNMNTAYDRIIEKLKQNATDKYEHELNERRKEAEKKGTIRTYNFKQNTVKNHLTGKVAPLKKVLNGDIELINNPVKE